MPNDPYHALEHGLAYAGIDQGIDFTGAGPVFALEPGTIIRDDAGGTGWPGRGAVLAEKFDKPVAGGFQYEYISEDFIAAQNLQVGSHVSAGQQVGNATGENLAPGIEVGFANAQGSPAAPRPAPRPANQYTAIGQAFHDFVEAVGGTHGSDVGGAGNDPIPVTSPPVNHAAGAAASAVGTAASDVWSVVDSVPKFIEWITNGQNIIRVGMFIGGGILIIGGFFVALGKPVPVPV